MQWPEIYTAIPAQIAWLGILLLILLALSGVLASWSSRIPGAVTEHEQEVARSKWGSKSAFAGRIAVSMLISTGFLLVFPFGTQIFGDAHTIVLASRAPNVSDTTWRQGKNLLSTAGEPALDAGPVVDRALSRLGERLQEWTRADAPGAKRILLEAALVALDTETPTKSSTAAQSHFRPPLGIPPWAVESLELAVLRGLIERLRPASLNYVIFPRATSLGSYQQIASTYLSNLQNLKAASITPFPVDLNQPRLLRVVSAEAKDNGTASFQLLVQGGDNPIEAPAVICVMNPITSEQPCSTPTVFKPRRLVIIDVAFSDPQVLQAKYLVQSSTGATAPLPVSRKEPLRLAIRGSAQVKARWAETLGELGGSSPGCHDYDSLRRWRQRNLAGRPVLVTPENPDDDGISVIDATKDNSIVIFPLIVADSVASLSLRRRNEPTNFRSERREILAFRTLRDAPAGADTLDDLLVESGSAEGFLSTVEDPEARPTVQVYSMLRRLRNTWTWDRQERSEPIDLVQVRYVRSRGTGGDDFRVVTYVGLDPSVQKVFISSSCGVDPGFDPDRFFAFWTLIVDAALRGAVPISGESISDPRETEALKPPMLLLSADNLQREATRNLTLPAGFFIAGMAIYGLLVVRGIRSLPRWSAER